MKQITSHIMMVRPQNFGFNAETAQSNAFQQKEKDLTDEEISIRAMKEFDQFVERLRSFGIKVTVVDDTNLPVKTDAVFPNNWVSFHESGTIVTYPMQAENRRVERRYDVVDNFSKNLGYKQHIKLEEFEKEGLYLEGTGSMILDRQNRIVYACRSERTAEELLNNFSHLLNYQTEVFDAADENGIPIYHTNVMMALGTSFCIICLESIAKDQRESLKDRLNSTDKEIIEITFDQMNHFAGNMLQLSNTEGSHALVMSSQAYSALRQDQIKRIQQHTEIIHSDLSTIEKLGGGSARCMIAEVFEPE